MKKFVALVMAVAMVAGLTACGGSTTTEDAAATTETAAGEKILSVQIGPDPETIDPALNSAVDGATTVAHLFSGLAKWAQDAEGKLVIAPDAAEALPEGVANEDGTVTYTYKLRSGMKWSNGDEVKASDFVNSWNRAASTELGADYGYMFEIVDGYAEMQKDATKKLNAIADDAAGTITVTIENAVNYWNELLAFPTYYPVHSSAFNNEAWATDLSTYICNGPYTMASWDHNSVITLKKNPNYFAAADVKNVSLTNLDVIAEVAAEIGYIKPEDVARLIAFRNNPSDESWIGGAK